MSQSSFVEGILPKVGSQLGGSRAYLRRATMDLHAALDASFDPSSLTSRCGYARYLLANSPCAWIEPALAAAGIHRLLPDWDRRQRRFALAADLETLHVRPPPSPPCTIAGDPGTLLGWSYVLEGSRLGARLVLKIVEQSKDREIRTATRFLRHGTDAGGGSDLWQSFTATLARIDDNRDAVAKACAAAICAFGCFHAALAQADVAASRSKLDDLTLGPAI